MATASEHRAPGAGSAAEERYAYMLLYAPGGTGKAGEPVTGGAWLQEQMSMLERAVPELGIGLGAGRVGAPGPVLEAVLGRGEAEGLVMQGRDGGISLTPRGMRAAESVWNGAGRRAREAVSWTKGMLNDMGYWELVSFARSASPGAEAAPGIDDELVKRRLESAVGLAMRHKVTAAKGAEIAGMATVDFVAELRKRGFHPYYTDMRTLEESMKTIDSIIGR